MSVQPDDVERVVLAHLEEILLVPGSRIRLSDDLIRDLHVDGDDLSFLFVPGVERDLDVRVPRAAWREVHTVQDAVDALRAARSKRR